TQTYIAKYRLLAVSSTQELVFFLVHFHLSQKAQGDHRHEAVSLLRDLDSGNPSLPFCSSLFVVRRSSATRPTHFPKMASFATSLQATGTLVPVLSKRCLESRKKGIVHLPRSHFAGCRLTLQPFHHKQVISHPSRLCSASLIRCSAALNARCAAEQTQTVTRQSSTVTIAPTQGKEKSPKLDDGGTGSPPRDDGGGGGGGGGGGPSSSGGFYLFAVLLFLGYLREKENEGDDLDPRRRYNRIY
ncbi:hypothetical protein Taro_044447, partial [Colocasia esculenta]|nr:hypothetical protein [Colocasia esculenta]